MSIISTVPKGAAVEGINPNLLRNWYFVGGGTGRGVFPVNSRGQTSYSGVSNAYTIDGWAFSYQTAGGNIVFNSNYISLSGGGLFFRQKIDAIPVNKTYTLTALFSDGTINSITGVCPSSTGDYVTVSGSPLSFNSLYARVYLAASVTYNVVAIKFEFGDQQTLCHQENGVWVLNEIPDYEEEYYRCITSDADSTDTYANQKVSNITVQCNSVGSSSLRYYNKLIQSTHKVLDSTFSNPAAQTSDITVTTYDGYLDFSNGFASGATTNITLVLGTSGPVLSTSTTAPS